MPDDARGRGGSGFTRPIDDRGAGPKPRLAAREPRRLARARSEQGHEASPTAAPVSASNDMR
ncbi:hypothetical protein NAEX_01595 [Nannocystis exedens]|nr:hypothetical protein NAEX_01595 [Nannocystis exedens]